MNEQPQHYELTFIVPGSVSEDEHQNILKQVKTLLEQNQASLTKEENLGRRKFSYPIKLLRHGFYFVLEFNAVKGRIKTLEKELGLNKQVLRFLLVSKKEKSEKEIAREETIKAKKIKRKIAEAVNVAEETKSREKEKENEAKKISLDDLDKKLDELLEEEIK